MAKNKRYLFNPQITPKNIAGNSDKIDEKAKKFVLDLFDIYESQRELTQGGVSYKITDLWDELYRIYMCIRNDDDHNYEGQARVFMPVGRRAVNVVNSETSNALFSREDYFSIDPVGKTDIDMANTAFKTLKFYSDQEDYVSSFELIDKQNEIYGCTVSEVVYDIDIYNNIERRAVDVPVMSVMGDEMVDANGTPQTEKKYELYKVESEVHRPKIIARDIYRVYCNLLADDPAKYDVIYKDEMSAQKLLEMAELGVYSKSAVKRLLKKSPTGSLSAGQDEQVGDGKTVVGDMANGSKDGNYEILRFQGLFTVENEDTGVKIRKQFWIDIGEQNEVLRLQENPLIGQDKTFTFCNYDTMISEFATDGVITPLRGLNYEINDKENQSLDGLSFSLNAPFEVLKSSGLDDSDIEEIYNTPHKPLYVREPNSIRKIEARFDLAHINAEISRLNSYADNVAGATSLAAGSPTGTQADRSGKALGILQDQTRSQFSKYVRKFERRMISVSLQKVFNLILQFSDDEIPLKLEDDGSIFMQKVSEITGRYNIRVDGGSQYLKERDMRDSILEFISVASSNDVFMGMLDHEAVLKDIAKASPHNMESYIDPESLYNKQKQQIDQLNQVVEQSNEQIKSLGGEVKRLNGELKQTDRSNMSSSPQNSKPKGGLG